MMNTTCAQGLFEMPFRQTLKLSPIMAVGISNALQRFRETQQPLENYIVRVDDEAGKEVITVAFVAKQKPGAKGLGNANGMGRGATYRVRRDNGEVVGESLHR